MQHYNKIHTYDAFGYRESNTVKPGDKRVTFDVAGTTVQPGDVLRYPFPRALRGNGGSRCEGDDRADQLAGRPGKLDQWRALTVARALDSTSYLVAAGMARPGAPDRYGHSDANGHRPLRGYRLWCTFGRNWICGTSFDDRY